MPRFIFAAQHHRARWSLRRGPFGLRPIIAMVGRSPRRAVAAAAELLEHVAGQGMSVDVSRSPVSLSCASVLRLTRREQFLVLGVDTRCTDNDLITVGAGIRPDVVVLLDGAVSRVASEKLSTLLYCLPPEGIAVVNGDSPDARAMSDRCLALRRTSFGREGDHDYRIHERSGTVRVSRVRGAPILLGAGAGPALDATIAATAAVETMLGASLPDEVIVDALAAALDDGDEQRRVG